MRASRLASVLCVIVLLSACSSTPPSETGDRTRLGEKKDGSRGGSGEGSKKVIKKAAKVGEKAQATGKSNGDALTSGSRAAGKPPTAATTSEVNPAFARRTASVDDPHDDAKKEGLTPAYAEILKASIVGLGEDFKLTLTLADDLPERMPNDKTHMIIAFGLTGTKEGEGFSFGAQATEEGWNAYAGGKEDGDGRFPGTFFVKGNAIEMTVPWTYIHGPRAFEWYAASNWFSQLANQTHYRIDLAPGEDLAKFPQ